MKNAPLQIGVAFVCGGFLSPKTVENGGLFGVDAEDTGEGTVEVRWLGITTRCV